MTWVCKYPDCDCPVSFPEGYKPSIATECPGADIAQHRAEEAVDRIRTELAAKFYEIAEELAKEHGITTQELLKITGKQLRKDLDVRKG